jgi:hypothetical protein
MARLPTENMLVRNCYEQITYMLNLCYAIEG